MNLAHFKNMAKKTHINDLKKGLVYIGTSPSNEYGCDLGATGYIVSDDDMNKDFSIRSLGPMVMINGWMIHHYFILLSEWTRLFGVPDFIPAIDIDIIQKEIEINKLKDEIEQLKKDKKVRINKKLKEYEQDLGAIIEVDGEEILVNWEIVVHEDNLKSLRPVAQ